MCLLIFKVIRWALTLFLLLLGEVLAPLVEGRLCCWNLKHLLNEYTVREQKVQRCCVVFVGAFRLNLVRLFFSGEVVFVDSWMHFNFMDLSECEEILVCNLPHYLQTWNDERQIQWVTELIFKEVSRRFVFSMRTSNVNWLPTGMLWAVVQELMNKTVFFGITINLEINWSK